MAQLMVTTSYTFFTMFIVAFETLLGTQAHYSNSGENRRVGQAWEHAAADYKAIRG